MSAVEAIAVSSAECKHGFSCMNSTVSDTRDSLAIPTVSSFSNLLVHLCISSNRCPTLKIGYAATDINSIAHQEQQNDKETEMSTVWK